MALTSTLVQFNAFVKKVKKDKNLFFFSPSLMKLPLKDPSVEPTKYFKEDYERIMQYVKLSQFVYIIPTASSSYEKILDRLKLKYKAAKQSPSQQCRPDKEILTAFCQKVLPSKVEAFRKSREWNKYVKIAQYDIKTSPYYDKKNNKPRPRSVNSNDVDTFTEDAANENDENQNTDDGKEAITTNEAFILSQDPSFAITGSHSQATNEGVPKPSESKQQAANPTSPKSSKPLSDKHEVDANDTDLSVEIIADDDKNKNKKRQSGNTMPRSKPSTNRKQQMQIDSHSQIDVQTDPIHSTLLHLSIESPELSAQSEASDIYDCDPFIVQKSDKQFNPKDAVNAFLSKNATYSILKDKNFKLFRDLNVRRDALKVYNLLFYRYTKLNEPTSTLNVINLYITSRNFFSNLLVAMEESMEAGKSYTETVQIYNEERRIGFIALLDNIIMTGVSFNMLYAMNFHALFTDIKLASDPRSIIDFILAVFFYGKKRKNTTKFWWKWIVPKVCERINQLKADRTLDQKGNQSKKWNYPYFEHRSIYNQVKYFSKRKADQMKLFAGKHEKNRHGLKRRKEFHRAILSNSPPSPPRSEQYDLESNPYLSSHTEQKENDDNTNNRLEAQRLVFDAKLNQVTNNMNAKMDKMAHNLNSSASRYTFSRFDTPQKKLISLQSHSICALTVDRTKDKEAAIYLAEAVAKEETRTHSEIIMEIMQRKMNGNKRADTASNKELIVKVEGLHL